MLWFDYSVLKYSPNKIRGEIINIGLVIFRPTGVDVRLLNTSHKLKMFDNSSNNQSIQGLQKAITDICSMVEDVEKQYKLLKSLSTDIFVGGKSAFSISDHSQYEPKVNSLFAKLVKPFSGRAPSVNKSRLHTTLKNEFRKMQLLADDPSQIDDHKIVSNFTIDSSSGLVADFMLKNGKYHMTEVIDFDLNDAQSKFKETTMKVMTFIEGRKNLATDMGRYLVYKASASKEKEIISHLNLAGDYSDEVFNIESHSDKASYFNMLIQLTGTQLTLN